MTPSTCYRRTDGLEPKACPKVQRLIENGEDGSGACFCCLIQDSTACPALDPLGASALAFSNTVDHPAHEPYREHLIPHLWPSLAPSELRGFLEGREVIWEFTQDRQRKALERAENERKAGTGSPVR